MSRTWSHGGLLKEKVAYGFNPAPLSSRRKPPRVVISVYGYSRITKTIAASSLEIFFVLSSSAETRPVGAQFAKRGIISDPSAAPAFVFFPNRARGFDPPRDFVGGGLLEAPAIDVLALMVFDEFAELLRRPDCGPVPPQVTEQTLGLHRVDRTAARVRLEKIVERFFQPGIRTALVPHDCESFAVGEGARPALPSALGQVNGLSGRRLVADVVRPALAQRIR